MTAARWAAAITVAAVVAVGMRAASHARVPLHRAGDAMLRVTWTARPERIERCRTATDAELAEVPEHMRQRVTCEGITARYRIEVRRDGALLAATVLQGGGLRRDRRLYYYREFAVPSGAATFEVRLARIDSGSAPADSATARGPGDADSEARRRDARDGRGRRVADEVPALLTLREPAILAPREVMLVTYDQSTRRLRAVHPPRE